MRSFVAPSVLFLGLGLASLLPTGCGGDSGGAADTTSPAADVTPADDAAATPDTAAPEAEATPVTCAMTAPLPGAIVGATVQVSVLTTGDADEVVLFANGEQVGSTAIAADGTASLAWTAPADGEAQLMAKALRADGASAFSGVLLVTVDRTSPVVGLSVDDFTVVAGSVALTATLVEAHPDTLRLLDDQGAVLATAFPGSPDLLLDTTALSDGLLRASLEATDQAGNVGTEPVTLVVANGGEQLEIEYIPMAKVSVPPNWQTTEYHTRILSEVRPGVKRLLSWVVWDPSGDWQMGYSIGQGTCPHNGIQYVAEESRSGEIVLDLRRTALDPAIVAKFPVADQTTDVFPVNDSPTTFGSFFGHVSPLDAADHVNESVDVRAGIVVYY